jgi:hypothetical protein
VLVKKWMAQAAIAVTCWGLAITNALLVSLRSLVRQRVRSVDSRTSNVPIPSSLPQCVAINATRFRD